MQDFSEVIGLRIQKHLILRHNITKTGKTKYEAIWKSKVEMPKYTQRMMLNSTDATFLPLP